MKLFAGCVSAIVLTIMGLPFLFTAGSPPDDPISDTCEPSAGGADVTAEIDAILATIRQRESGGDYQARAPGSSASGAYQFIDTTWAGHGGYAEAWEAPPEVQDAKATEHITGILDAHNGAVDAVPVVWYIGWYPAEDDPAWDTVPAPGAGNVLTPRQYRDEWMDAHLTQHNGENEDDRVNGCANRPLSDGEVLPGDFAYPGPTELFATAPVDSPHHDYPAWDWAIDEGTPVYAIRGGDIVWAADSPHNCFNGAGAACQPCGTGVTIEDDTQTRWTYCHGSQLHVQEGDVVSAGTLILTTGNSGRSTGPHLHLALRTNDGTDRCPQPLLEALRDGGTGLHPVDLPTAGCSY